MLNTSSYGIVAQLTLHLRYSEFRLANVEEGVLHLNDVIITDNASCNQGQSTLREIHREVLYASIDRRSVEAVVSFDFYLPQWQSGKRKHREGWRRE